MFFSQIDAAKITRNPNKPNNTNQKQYAQVKITSKEHYKNINEENWSKTGKKLLWFETYIMRLPHEASTQLALRECKSKQQMKAKIVLQQVVCVYNYKCVEPL